MPNIAHTKRLSFLVSVVLIAAFLTPAALLLVEIVRLAIELPVSLALNGSLLAATAWLLWKSR